MCVTLLSLRCLWDWFPREGSHLLLHNLKAFHGATRGARLESQVPIGCGSQDVPRITYNRTVGPVFFSVTLGSPYVRQFGERQRA